MLSFCNLDWETRHQRLVLVLDKERRRRRVDASFVIVALFPEQQLRLLLQTTPILLKLAGDFSPLIYLPDWPW
jgi:hypothetical protein